MTTRYYAEQLCPHGRMELHPFGPLASVSWCPGGSRRELTIDYEAAMAAFRYETNWDEQPKGYNGADSFEDLIRMTVDAALSGDPQ